MATGDTRSPSLTCFTAGETSTMWPLQRPLPFLLRMDIREADNRVGSSDEHIHVAQLVRCAFLRKRFCRRVEIKDGQFML
ncbi:uncharacterized protein MYCFIDRAFT_202756 [Pseudocercospora fijiensis CIRAD86]|uniref:Uncharacterized protein n=1 Tax=Pseudocercospora fijiensis (strain CIRAD86) TaxID=383855 RepID=M3BCT7_PSEFD|nr:uncharacterized protein MYCFIDRAFT_202756 [Pseudocercospora fijiensis CIRAD86]EME87092.1 hypothetical protein MYCFIDRAFT_202756 [Pseudocercospora fijiensis CIRAD86]